jgi:hypothetical protein
MNEYLFIKMNPCNFYTLPQEILSKIYGYDNTYRNIMKKCLSHVRLCAARKIRIQKEIARLSTEPDVIMHSPLEAIRNLRIVFRGNMYRLHIPVDYPFEQPVIFYNGEKYRKFEQWSPAASLLTVLLTCDVEKNEGTVIC